MVHAKNYEAVSTFVKVMQRKLWPLLFPDTVYIPKGICNLGICKSSDSPVRIFWPISPGFIVALWHHRSKLGCKFDSRPCTVGLVLRWVTVCVWVNQLSM